MSYRAPSTLSRSRVQSPDAPALPVAVPEAIYPKVLADLLRKTARTHLSESLRHDRARARGPELARALASLASSARSGEDVESWLRARAADIGDSGGDGSAAVWHKEVLERLGQFLREAPEVRDAAAAAAQDLWRSAAKEAGMDPPEATVPPSWTGEAGARRVRALALEVAAELFGRKGR